MDINKLLAVSLFQVFHKLHLLLEGYDSIKKIIAILSNTHTRAQQTHTHTHVQLCPTHADSHVLHILPIFLTYKYFIDSQKAKEASPSAASRAEFLTDPQVISLSGFALRLVRHLICSPVHQLHSCERHSNPPHPPLCHTIPRSRLVAC